MLTSKEIWAKATAEQKVAERYVERLERLDGRITKLEVQRPPRHDTEAHEALMRRVQVAERAIWWLETNALRPEDRPPPVKETAAPEARAEEELRRTARYNRDMDGLEARCTAIEDAIRQAQEKRSEADRRLTDLLNRLEVLEEKCLTPEERNSESIHMRGRFNPSVPIFRGGPGPNVAKSGAES
jgi:hypothetical protein